MVRSRFKPVATGQKAQMNPLCFGLNIGIEIVPKVLKQSVCYFDFMPTQVLNTNNGKLIKTSQLRKAYFNKPFVGFIKELIHSTINVRALWTAVPDGFTYSFHYLHIYYHENLPNCIQNLSKSNCIQNLSKSVTIFAKYYINPHEIDKYILVYAKETKFRQICSHQLWRN